MKEFPDQFITRVFLAISEMHKDQFAVFLEKNNDRFLSLKNHWTDAEWIEQYHPMLAQQFCSILSIREIAQGITGLTISHRSLGILEQKRLSNKNHEEQGGRNDSSWFIDALFSGSNPKLEVIEKNGELHIAFSGQTERSERISSENENLFSYLKKLGKNNSDPGSEKFKEYIKNCLTLKPANSDTSPCEQLA